MMGEESKYLICSLLGVAFAASLFIIWLILFRLRSHLVSTSYKFIFGGKVCFAILTGGGMYLVLWPLRVRIAWVSMTWFALLAIGTISSAIGFWLYARDVNAILQSSSYTESLPAIPPVVTADNTHKSETPDSNTGEGQ
jgi:hypothetical protein